MDATMNTSSGPGAPNAGMELSLVKRQNWRLKSRSLDNPTTANIASSIAANINHHSPASPRPQASSAPSISKQILSENVF
jgi:hypothetical protein